jgi:hypothetical protein
MWNSTNPFWYDIAALEDVNVEQQREPEAGMQAGIPARPLAAASGYGGQHTARLPDFWPHAPGMWFARAECRFELMGVESERQKFCCVTDALPYETMRLVADLVAAPPAVAPYSVLKERLLLAHELTPVQRAEKLFAMPQLGARRPSDLLAAMFEYCPAGEENTALFQALFLTRLPAEIRVHVESSRDLPLKELAVKADQLWLTLAAKQQQLAVVAAAVGEQQAEETGDLVAAVKGKFNHKFKGRKQAKGDGQQGQQMAKQDGAGPGNKQKLVSLQLCWRHARFGADAYNCADQAACQWPGN